MLNFDSATHTYTYNGKVYPSVTQIISEWRLIDVYGSKYYLNNFDGTVIGEERMNEARDHGNAVHAGFPLIIEGTLDWDLLHPSLVKPLRGFEKWLCQYKPTILHVEQPLISLKHGFAGTPDIICEINKKLWIVDVKSGAYGMAGVQIAGYSVLAKEQLRYRRPIRRAVLSLGKANSKFLQLTNRLDWQCFKAYLFEHWWREAS